MGKKVYAVKDNGVRVVSQRTWNVDTPAYVYDLWMPLLGAECIGVLGVYYRLERDNQIRRTLKEIARACRVGTDKLAQINDTLIECGFITMKKPQGWEKREHYTTVIVTLDAPKQVSKALIEKYGLVPYEPLCGWLVDGKIAYPERAGDEEEDEPEDGTIEGEEEHQENPTGSLSGKPNQVFEENPTGSLSGKPNQVFEENPTGSLNSYLNPLDMLNPLYTEPSRVLEHTHTHDQNQAVSDGEMIAEKSEEPTEPLTAISAPADPITATATPPSDSIPPDSATPPQTLLEALKAFTQTTSNSVLQKVAGELAALGVRADQVSELEAQGRAALPVDKATNERDRLTAAQLVLHVRGLRAPAAADAPIAVSDAQEVFERFKLMFNQEDRRLFDQVNIVRLEDGNLYLRAAVEVRDRIEMVRGYGLSVYQLERDVKCAVKWVTVPPVTEQNAETLFKSLLMQVQRFMSITERQRNMILQQFELTGSGENVLYVRVTKYAKDTLIGDHCKTAFQDMLAKFAPWQVMWLAAE